MTPAGPRGYGGRTEEGSATSTWWRCYLVSVIVTVKIKAVLSLCYTLHSIKCSKNK